jgi:hypothetical protein
MNIEIKEKKNVKIELLFPIPIVFIDLGRELTEIEKSAIAQFKNDPFENIGNLSSNNNYVLNDKRLKNLKEFFLQESHNYFKNFCNPKNNIEFYITQSWLNMTDTNQFHHKHNHSNSFLSGVFYVEADEELDNISFHNSLKPFILDFESDAPPTFFAKYLHFKVKKNTLIIFPSTLTHNVNKTESKNTRISLAFNTFVKGSFGLNKGLSELILT